MVRNTTVFPASTKPHAPHAIVGMSLGALARIMGNPMDEMMTQVVKKRANSWHALLVPMSSAYLRDIMDGNGAKM